jgi:hypothetical protein
MYDDNDTKPLKPMGDGDEKRSLTDNAQTHDGEVVVGEMRSEEALSYAYEGIPVVRFSAVVNGAQCFLCDGDNANNDLFQPCKCPTPGSGGPRYYHRQCFRKWRAGWINPQNYFACPECMHSYNIERVSTGTDRSDSKQRMMRNYRLQLAKFWLAMLLIIGGTIAVIAGIAYGSDTEDKNVPVAVKYMMSSVISGTPSEGSAAKWREQFKQPDVSVWPYYTLLGCLVASLMILFAFAMIGCTFDPDERKSRGCCQQCGGGGGSNTNDGWIWCYYGGGGGGDDCTCCSGGGGNCDCGSGGCSGGDCKCDGGGEAIVIIAVVVIVIILVSAIFVIIAFSIKKWALFHDRVTDMLYNQAAELEKETIVLGVDERLRPTDMV